MVKKIGTDRGLIKMIVLIVIALLILSYLGFNLRNLVNSPTTQDNFSYVISFLGGLWNNFLKAPVLYLWNTILLPYVWNPIFHHLQTNPPVTS
jgi:hypothetical protein